MRKKIIVVFISLIVGLTSNAFAVTIDEKIQAVYADFNFLVNGEVKEINTLPVVIDGTSYLPIREITNMLGYDVTYKADSRTIELNNSISINQELGDDNIMTQSITENIVTGEYKGLKSITINGQTYFNLRDYSLKFEPISWGYDSNTETLYLAKHKENSTEIIEIFVEINKNDPNVFMDHNGASYINTKYYQEVPIEQ